MESDMRNSKRVVLVMSDHDLEMIKAEALSRKKRIRDIVIEALNSFYDTKYWNSFDKYKYKSTSDKREENESMLVTGDRPSISLPLEDYERLEAEHIRTGYSKSVIIRNALSFYFEGGFKNGQR